MTDAELLKRFRVPCKRMRDVRRPARNPRSVEETPLDLSESQTA